MAAGTPARKPERMNELGGAAMPWGARASTTSWPPIIARHQRMFACRTCLRPLRFGMIPAPSWQSNFMARTTAPGAPAPYPPPGKPVEGHPLGLQAHEPIPVVLAVPVGQGEDPDSDGFVSGHDSHRISGYHRSRKCDPRPANGRPWDAVADVLMGTPRNLTPASELQPVTNRG
jgi:hypothetical protein